MEIPEKGDLVFLNFSPQSGHEQAGNRPGIVLSPKLFNQGTFIIVCPITLQKKDYPFEVELTKGLEIEGVILTDQVRSLDWRSRNLKVVDTAPKQIIEKCLTRINTIINE